MHLCECLWCVYIHALHGDGCTWECARELCMRVYVVCVCACWGLYKDACAYVCVHMCGGSVFMHVWMGVNGSVCMCACV